VFPAETGLVQFKDGNTLLATAVLSVGNATYKTIGLAAGSHSLTANFVGTASAAASSSAASILTLNPGATAASLQITGSNPVNLGAAAQLTATVSANGGGLLNGSANLINNGSSITSASLGTPINTFATSQTLSTGASGNEPFIIAMADVNGDGIPDLVTTDSVANSVSVFLGNGNGTFNLKSTITTGISSPRGIAIGDFNADGKLDFAVISDGSTTMQIFKGNGDGTFVSPPTNMALDSNSIAWDIATADVNNDGKLDLIIADSGTNSVTVFLGNGDGTFAPEKDTVLTTGTGPKFLTVADLNGDGKLDVAVADYNNAHINVLFGNGDGTFASTQTVISTSSYPETIVAGDVNRDGSPDLVVTNYGSNTVSVFLNNGHGVFALKGNYPTGLNPYGLAVADIDGDGKPDLVVTNRDNGGVTGVQDTVSLLLGNGDGTFNTQTTYPTGKGPVGVVVGDFNGAGRPDLAVVNYDAGTVSVLVSSTSAQAVLTTSSLPGGSNPLTAQYAGNSSFASSTSSSVTQTINQATSVTALSAPSGLTYNAPITLTATVTGIGGIVPTGTVSLYNGASPVGSPVSLNNGTASIPLSLLPVGTYNTYTAVYGGDNSYTGSTSPAPSFTVQQATPTVSTWPTASLITYGQTLAYSTLSGGSATPSGGAFTFTSLSTAPTAGTATQSVKYTPADTTDYSTVTGTVSVTVNQAGALVTLGNLTQTYSGSAEPVTVSTTPTGLALNFSYTGINATSYPSSTTAPTNPGTYSVVASVFDPNYIGQGGGTLTINQLSPALNLALISGAPATTPYGTTVYFALGMASTPLCPTGTVQLYVDGSPSGSAISLNGASCTLPVQLQAATLMVGPHSISAVYSGDTYYQGGTSGTLSYTVTQDTTSVTLAASSTSGNVGQSLTFTATVTPAPLNPSALPPAGTVQFFDGVTPIGTGALSTTAPYTATYGTSVLGAGSHSISATFVDSDGNFAGNSSSVNTETVNLNVPTINWQASPKEFVYGTALGSTQLNATAVDINGNTVSGTFGYNFVTGTVLPVGTVNLIATFTPTDPTTYSSNSATFTITVDPAPLTVTANNASMVYGQSLPSFSYTVTGFVNNDPSSVASGLASCSTSATASSAVGGYPINCSQGTLLATNYTFQFVTGTLTVTQATPTITWATPAVIPYGTALSTTQLNATSGGVAGTLVYTPAAGAVLTAGPHTLSVTFTPTDTTDYTAVNGSANITVNKATPTLNWAAPAVIPYGTALSTTQLNATSGGVAGTFVYTPAAGSVLTAGSQTLSVTFNPSDVADYTTATATVALTVAQEPLTVTISPSSYSRAVGAANPTFTGTVVGAVNNDLTNGKLVITYSTTASTSSPIGSYLITATLSGPAAASYAPTINPGTLTVWAQGVDLIESAVSGPVSAGSGSTIQVTDTVKNQGITSAGGSTTGFYLSTNGTTEGTYLGYRYVGTLSAGASSGPVTTTLTLPASVTGNYYVMACANFNNGITESNTTNNCTAAPITLAGPDLIESAVSVLTTTPASGGSLLVSDTVLNQGGGIAGGSTTGFYLSTNGTTKGTLLGYRYVGTLSAGASSGPVTTSLTLPTSVTGSYYVMACANYNNGITESNTANNCTAAQITVAGADLIESAVSILTTTPALGGSVQISDTTLNQGGGIAGMSTTGFYLSTNGVAKGTYLGYRYVGTLNASTSSGAVTTTLTLPSSMSGGNYYVIACANYNNGIVESNSANDCTASSNTMLVP
jgi:hypothetical protein